jgi:hypothetical protein
MEESESKPVQERSKKRRSKEQQRPQRKTLQEINQRVKSLNERRKNAPHVQEFMTKRNVRPLITSTQNTIQEREVVSKSPEKGTL